MAVKDSTSKEMARVYSRRYREKQLQTNRDAYLARCSKNHKTYREKQLLVNGDEYKLRRKAENKRWRERNLETQRARNRAVSRERKMLYEARCRAKKNSIPFNLELSDVIIPAVCPVLGIPIERGAGSHHPNSPSLDRAIPDLGYVRGNITVISFRANTLKNNASVDEIEMLLRWMRERAAIRQ